jgi:ABC-type lipoprotein export system ATPase subunit
VKESSSDPTHAGPRSAARSRADSQTPLVELRGASRHYEIGGATVRALDAADLRVDAGEFVVILGPSGSGKTTLLNLIGALDVPTSGSVLIEGRDITSASRRDQFALRRHTIGFIFQSFNLFPGLSALENIQFGADVAGRDDARQAEAAYRRTVAEWQYRGAEGKAPARHRGTASRGPSSGQPARQEEAPDPALRSRLSAPA